MGGEEDEETERNTDKNLGSVSMNALTPDVSMNALTPDSRPGLYRGVSWYTPKILPLERPIIQEDYEFESRLDYIAR